MQVKSKKNTEISERISQVIEYLSVTPNKFSKNLGYDRTQTIYDVLNGKSAPSFDFFSRFYNSEYSALINPHWLLTGRGRMIDAEKGTLHVFEVSESRAKYGRGIPYYDLLPASAGDITSLIADAKPTSYVDLPQITGCIALLPVHGSSMKGVVEPGDLIAIKEVVSRNEFDPSLPYLVITDEHRMVKYLHTDEADNSIIWAESTNHARIRLNSESIKMVYAIKCVIRFF